ncbi:MAG: hypothetical protein MJZ34_02530 [Paludibacteraceae bacterium]|nr:hypothetical protein [Paludibacteraceae bacterium]
MNENLFTCVDIKPNYVTLHAEDYETSHHCVVTSKNIDFKIGSRYEVFHVGDSIDIVYFDTPEKKPEKPVKKTKEVVEKSTEKKKSVVKKAPTKKESPKKTTVKKKDVKAPVKSEKTKIASKKTKTDAKTVKPAKTTKTTKTVKKTK